MEKKTCGFGSSFNSFYIDGSLTNNREEANGPYSLSKTKSCLNTVYNNPTYTAFGKTNNIKQVKSDILYLIRNFN